MFEKLLFLFRTGSIGMNGGLLSLVWKVKLLHFEYECMQIIYSWMESAVECPDIYRMNLSIENKTKKTSYQN